MTPGAPARQTHAFRWFRWYGRKYVARRFHAVRLARGGYRPRGGEPPGPLLVVMNHPSWWDPMVGLVLTDLWPGLAHVAPIQAAALAKYPFLEWVGLFPLDEGTARGARAFLTRGAEALADPGKALWVTAQGRFVDARERPTRLKPGVGHLARRASSGSLLPLALEYAFWEESTPEAFARFGPPIPLGPEGDASPSARADRVARALEAEQDALAVDVRSRDPARFETVLGGRSGVGGVYDVWRRAKALVRGRRFEAGHGPTELP